MGSPRRISSGARKRSPREPGDARPRDQRTQRPPRRPHHRAGSRLPGASAQEHEEDGVGVWEGGEETDAPRRLYDGYAATQWYRWGALLRAAPVQAGGHQLLGGVVPRLGGIRDSNLCVYYPRYPAL
ncbi:hypothetical protein V494_01985 [Pseudogymnoascus sp. VKM F-4513 (FW-928)]|nr:hypothetical protein V494_01985 [Pseudogymnoascus sp. VKM F-4513 (FW-928)]